MRLMMGQMRGKTILFWFGHNAPSDTKMTCSGLGHDPLFVKRRMIGEVAPYVTNVVEVVPSFRARTEGSKGIMFNQLEGCAANELPGVRPHAKAAATLVKAIAELS
jgi:hypothetical protein